MSQSHWTEKYVGLPVGNGFDCASLAELVVREVFGKVINLPKERDYARVEKPIAKFHAMQEQIQQWKGHVAQRIQEPIEGCGVLLYTRGYKQHIGIYAEIQGEGWILHACSFRIGPQVVLQRERVLNVHGIRIEGYYRWI